MHETARKRAARCLIVAATFLAGAGVVAEPAHAGGPDTIEKGDLKQAERVVALSGAGARFVASFEGTYLYCYRDPVGIWTIGIGHVGCSPGQRITLDRAYELLQADASIAARAVDQGVTRPLNQNQIDALISFTFNVGVNGFGSSTLLRKLNEGCYRCVPDELKRWVYAGGRTLAGLVRRRAAEGELFVADLPTILRKLTESQARNVQASETPGLDVEGLRDFIAYFQHQIERSKASLAGDVGDDARAIFRARVKVLRREKAQIRKQIKRARDIDERQQKAAVEEVQPATAKRAERPDERDGREITVDKVPARASAKTGYANGRIPTTALSPIFNAGGSTVYLSGQAAAAWNAMALLAATRKDLGTPQVNGPDSAYRTYARQVYWKNYWCGRGLCGNAATPGTSNHGWGLAVDVPGGTQQILRAIGPQFGWNKACSDAPWEAWHFKWCGGYSRPDPGTDRRNPLLRRGSGGPGQAPWVRRAQRRLTKHGHKVADDGSYGVQTKRAVARFQAEHRITPRSGVVGPLTWRALRRAPEPSK